MTQFADRFGTPLLAALALMLVAAAFVVSDGYLLVDEFVYVLTAKAFGSGTPFFLENGTDRFSSPDLVFFNLVAGPNGLVSQYPVGTDIVAGPPVAMLGARGLIVVNALAAGATLFLTRAIAFRLYRDRGVALGAALILGLCSFLADYALAIWPHALGLFFCAAAILAALRALDAGAGADMGFAALAGLMAGAAALVRMDSILILPVLGAVLIVYAARPVRLALAGAVGLAPALALGSYANHLKFDTWNPISYGASNGGGIDLATHTGPIIALAAGLAVLAGLRQLTWRPEWRWPVVIGIAVTGALLWALVPQVQSAAARYAFGFDTLIMDVRDVPDGRGGIIDRPDGTVSFWGLPKKALGQSLPWIAFLAVVFLRPWGERRRAHLFCLAALGIWTLPFIMIAWHGGPGSSTRYFLGLLPILSTLGALALADLLALANRGVRPLVLGFGLGATLVLVWPLAGPGGYFGAHQVLPTYLLIAGFAVALIISVFPRPATA
ncbi:MAG: hypothetical protein KJO78_02930, partial [Alphaproteobacteria bacterium]|nr:hypothetical protein [Alphaproteobacteria bacterium]